MKKTLSCLRDGFDSLQPTLRVNTNKNNTFATQNTHTTLSLLRNMLADPHTCLLTIQVFEQAHELYCEALQVSMQRCFARVLLGTFLRLSFSCITDIESSR
jgi:hypothetical protein